MGDNSLHFVTNPWATWISLVGEGGPGRATMTQVGPWRPPTASQLLMDLDQ